MEDDSYDVVSAWHALRKKHAEECFQFIVEHQAQCVSIYDEEIAPQTLQQNLSDKLAAWFAEHDYSDEGMQFLFQKKAQHFVESLARLEKPKVQSRMAKEKENLALTDATRKWQSMDVKDVLAPALLELSQHGSSRKKPIKTPDDSALAFLVKDNADLCDKYKLKITAASPQAGTSSGSSQKRRPTPKKASARGRQYIAGPQKDPLPTRARNLIPF